MTNEQRKLYDWLLEAKSFEIARLELEIYFSTHKNIDKQIIDYFKQKNPIIKQVFDIYYGINQPEEKNLTRISEKVNRTVSRIRLIVQEFQNHLPFLLINKIQDKDFINIHNKLLKMKRKAEEELNK